MTVRGRLLVVLTALMRPVRLPVRLLHETTHIAAATPWLADWQIVIGPTDSPDELGVDIAFDEDAPVWGIALAYLAPMLLGLVGMALVGVGILVDGIPLPDTTLDLALWSAAGLGWFLYTAPSVADVHGALAIALGDDDA